MTFPINKNIQKALFIIPCVQKTKINLYNPVYESYYGVHVVLH